MIAALFSWIQSILITPSLLLPFIAGLVLMGAIAVIVSGSSESK